MSSLLFCRRVLKHDLNNNEIDTDKTFESKNKIKLVPVNSDEAFPHRFLEIHGDTFDIRSEHERKDPETLLSFLDILHIDPKHMRVNTDYITLYHTYM